MTDARRGRGAGNNNLTAYQNSKLWESIKQPEESDCKNNGKHNRIAFKSTGKECLDCGKVLS